MGHWKRWQNSCPKLGEEQYNDVSTTSDLEVWMGHGDQSQEVSSTASSLMQSGRSMNAKLEALSASVHQCNRKVGGQMAVRVVLLVQLRLIAVMMLFMSGHKPQMMMLFMAGHKPQIHSNLSSIKSCRIHNTGRRKITYICPNLVPCSICRSYTET